MEFTGWVPTITGRLSFSRIGRESGNHGATVCNKSGPSRVIFGYERRVSRDAPLPAPVMRLAGRVDASHYFFALESAQANLRLQDLSTGRPVEVPDNQGKLQGTVLIGVDQAFDRPSLTAAAIRFRIAAREADQSPETDGPAKLAAARADIDALWRALIGQMTVGPERCPAFARAQVTLFRTGECRIEIDPGEVWINRTMKFLHTTGAPVSPTDPAVIKACRMVARHIFNAVRDWTHRHYHHDPYSDLTTSVYPSSATDDEEWRRETQYGLVRMAIRHRREGSSLSFKQSLGIISYAEAFQAHLALYKQNSHGAMVKCDQVHSYDFAALKSSMDASLRQSDLDDARSRESLIYTVGTLLTFLGVVLGSAQIYKPSEISQACEGADCRVDSFFWMVSQGVVRHPIETIAVGVGLCWLLLIARGRILRRTPVYRSLRGGYTRFLDALLGGLMQLQRQQSVAFWVTVALSAGLTMGIGWLGFDLLARAASGLQSTLR